VSQRDDDLGALAELLDRYADELTDAETEAFAGMRFNLTAGPRQQLTDKQRAWVLGVRERVVPQYANLVSQGLVPRGREVPTPPVLQNLPKRPPPLPEPAAGPQRVSRRHCGRQDEGCYAFVNGDCSCACCAGGGRWTGAR
jgi:hypothetical protein